MSSYKKNLIVGITVLGSLILLGVMILKFGDAPARLFVEPQFTIRIIADRADGINAGSPVLYRGVNVGRVSAVTIADNQRDIIIDARIDQKWPIPGNVSAVIRTQGLIGSGAALVLETNEPSGPHLADNQQLHATFVGLDVLPPAFTELAADLKLTSKQFRESNLVIHLDQAVQTVQQQLVKVGQILDNVQTIVGDETMRDNIRVAVANVRTATETANRIGATLEQTSAKLNDLTTQAQGTIQKTEGHIDQLAKDVSGRIEQVAKLLETFQSIADKVNTGQGTAGLLLNDPKLYQGLVEISQQLSATMFDLKRLVEQWEQEGMTLKLNK
ncbi:MAG: MCE family protein [Phycisphaerales bacterium]|nr:MCE family protein [Phycisphaerales bacterium]